MPTLSPEAVAAALPQHPRLRKQVFRLPGPFVREVRGVFGFYVPAQGRLDLLHGRELWKLIWLLDEALTSAFRPSLRLRSPAVVLEFNRALPDAGAVSASTAPSQPAAPAENIDLQRAAEFVQAESRLLATAPPFDLLEARYAEGKILMRGLFGEDKQVVASDRRQLSKLASAIEAVLKEFSDLDWLRLDAVTVIFNPHDYSGPQIKSAPAAQRVPASPESPVASAGESLAGLPQAPRHGWGEIVLPAEVEQKLAEFFFEFQNVDYLFAAEGRDLGRIGGRQAFVLNLHGPPGTGKSTLAHSIAAKLERKIIEVTYAQIENSLVGEAAKTLRRTFRAAEEGDAILFLDEADSLLSHRPTTFSQGTDYHISSLRSELFTEISKFKGILILATNNASAYDKAFVSRISLAVEMGLPDASTRQKIWEVKLLPQSSRNPELGWSEIVTASEGLSGRDIQRISKRAVIQAAMQSREQPVQTESLVQLIQRYKEDLQTLSAAAKPVLATITRIPKGQTQELPLLPNDHAGTQVETTPKQP